MHQLANKFVLFGFFLSLSFVGTPQKAKAMDPTSALVWGGSALVSTGCIAMLVRSAYRKSIANQKFRWENSLKAQIDDFFKTKSITLVRYPEIYYPLYEVIFETARLLPYELDSFFIFLYQLSPEPNLLLQRLRWHLPRVKAALDSKNVDLEDWLEFTALEKPKQAWKQLEEKGWKVTPVDRLLYSGSDAMFSVDGEKKVIYLRIVPYANSGPLVAMWAVFTAQASYWIERGVSGDDSHHLTKIRDWIDQNILSDSSVVPAILPDSKEHYMQVALAYLARQYAWKELYQHYVLLELAHPEFESPLFEFLNTIDINQGQNIGNYLLAQYRLNGTSLGALLLQNPLKTVLKKM